MIKTRKELKQALSIEKKLYLPESSKDLLLMKLTRTPNFYLLKYIKLLRKTEFHYNNRKQSIFHSIMYLQLRRRKNKLGSKIGIEIFENCFDVGLQIYHFGNIVVNGCAKIGKNCKIHGSNCIGNNGFNNNCPVIGDNVRIGVGAKIIGNIEIADDIVIAAGAVVVSSFLTKGVVIGGVPAKVIKNKEEND